MCQSTNWKWAKICWLIRKSQIHIFLKNSAQLCLKTVLKVFFLNDFCDMLIWIRSLHAKFVMRKSMSLRTCGIFKSINHNKIGSTNLKSAKCHICLSSANLTIFLSPQLCWFVYAEFIFGLSTFESKTNFILAEYVIQFMAKNIFYKSVLTYTVIWEGCMQNFRTDLVLQCTLGELN